MNVIQWHLMLNHVPVIGVLIGTALMFYACFKKNLDLQRFSLGLLFLLALITLPVYFTGEPVETLVESIAGISDTLVEPHEHAAKIALVGIEILGLISLAGLVVYRKAPGFPRRFLAVVLLGCIGVSLLMAWTAHLGGLIRHTELETASKLVSRPQDSYFSTSKSEKE